MSDLTYLELINEIANRLDRDDQNSNIRKIINDRIEHYGKNFFYSSEIVDESIVTTAGTRFYALPLRWAAVTNVQCFNGVWIPMHKRMHDVINGEDNLQNALQSLPFHWCLFGGQLRIWPCGAGYRLQLTMNQTPAAPVDDSDITFWSTDAQSLMINATAELICKFHIHDPVRAQDYKDLRIVDERELGSKSIRASGGVKFQPWL